MNIPVMLSVLETALRAGVPECAVRRWIADGQICAVRSGKRFWVQWASVEKFIGGAFPSEGEHHG